MIKWPEPVVPEGDWLVRDQYIREYAAKAVRDALTLAATQCKALDNDENSEDYRNGANWCAERIRALIKEIPE